MTAQSICPCSVSLSSSSSSGRRSHSQSWRPIGIGENVSIIMCIHTFLVSLYVCMCVFLCAWIVACLSLCVCLRLCVRFLALLRTYEWCARYNVVIDTFWYQITWNYNKQHGTQTYTYRTTHTHRCKLVITVFVTTEGRRQQQQQKQIIAALPAGAISGARLCVCVCLWCACRRDRQQLTCIGQAQILLCLREHAFCCIYIITTNNSNLCSILQFEQSKGAKMRAHGNTARDTHTLASACIRIHVHVWICLWRSIFFSRWMLFAASSSRSFDMASTTAQIETRFTLWRSCCCT